MMSNQEDNCDDGHNSLEEDSDEEGGGMKPAYSIEDLVNDMENCGEEKKMTLSRSTAGQSDDSALDGVNRGSKSGESSLQSCHGNDDSEKGVLDKSAGQEKSENAKEEGDEIYENALTVRERKRMSRESGSEEPKTSNIEDDSKADDTVYANPGEKETGSKSRAEHSHEKIYDAVAEEDDGQKGGTLVPGQHLRHGDEPSGIYENVDRGPNTGGKMENSEDDGWDSSEFEDYGDSDGQSQQSQESLTPGGDGSSGATKAAKKRGLPWPRSQDLPSPSTNPGSSMFEKVAGRFSQKFRHDSDTESSEDSGVLEVAFNYTKHPPPQLPPAPVGLSPQQLRRRHIVSMIIESEKSYSATLLRLVEDYEKPLLEARPQIVTREVIRVIFYKIRDILQCHNMFQIELSATADIWDAEEKIGDVFTASFSKSLVFDVYKAFVINFSAALETTKRQARKQTTFAEFLNQKLEASEDRLSLFGLLVKPVQRFPQFIMMLQDLLRFTPKDHHDRLSLQLALSELESLTDRLNEAKRDSESRLEVRRLLNNMNAINSVLLKVDEENSFLVRQDDILEIKQKNGEPYERQRRLFLLNDQLICAEVHKRDSISTEKFIFHWSIPIKEVEVIESTLPSSYTIQGKTFTLSKKPAPAVAPSETNPYKKELDDMIHDLAIFQSMLLSSDQLRLKYSPGFDPEVLHIQARSLQTRIGLKCDIEHSLLTLSLPTKPLQLSTERHLKDQVAKHIGKVGRAKSLSDDTRIQFTFQFGSKAIKHDWLQELQDTKSATDPSCHPAWHTAESNQPSCKNPRFHQPLLLDVTKEDSKRLLKSKKKSKDMVQCATCVVIPSADNLGHGVQHLWVCNGDQSRGQVTVVSLNTNQPCVTESFKVCDSLISSVESVPASGGGQVWMGTEEKKIVICDVVENDRSKKRRTVNTDSVVTCMKYLNAKVFAGTKNGMILVYCFKDGEWNWKKPLKQALGGTRVSCLLPVNLEMWISSNLTIHKLTVSTASKVSTISKESHDLSSDCGQIECMVKAGVGLLVAFSNRAVIRLYHMETLQHLQDINIASAITPLLEGKQLVSPFSEDKKLFSLNITSLLSGNGLLWVGTNYGFILTLPLPRLEGVPQVKRRPAVSYHAQGGPVRFLASIHCGNTKLVSVSSIQQTNADTKLLENIEKKSVMGNDELGPVRQRDTKMFDEDEPSGLEEGVDVHKNGTLLRSSQWNSTPDLRSLNDSDSDGDVESLFKNLLQGVDADMDSQLVRSLLGRSQSKGQRFSQNFNTAVSSRVSQLSKSVRRTFSPSVQVRNSSAKFYSVISDVTDESTLDNDEERANGEGANEDKVNGEKANAVMDGSSVGSTSEALASEPYNDKVTDDPVSDECTADSNSDSKIPDVKQPVVHLGVKDSTASANSVVILPGSVRHVAHSKRFLVVSGGEGYVNWKEKKPFDKSYEDICLLHWKC